VKRLILIAVLALPLGGCWFTDPVDPQQTSEDGSGGEGKTKGESLGDKISQGGRSVGGPWGIGLLIIGGMVAEAARQAAKRKKKKKS